jgi:ATP-dependent protease ClpP protease subunit
MDDPAAHHPTRAVRAGSQAPHRRPKPEPETVVTQDANLDYNTPAGAEAYKHLMEAELMRQQAAEAKAKARVARVSARKAEHEERARLADSERNHVTHFETAVRDTEYLRAKLDTWHRLDETADWTIIMNSPGGSVIDGMALFDHLVAHSIRGGGTHHITIKVRGMAASMGGILLQAADHRVCGPESYVLIHKISTMTGGSLDDIEDEVKLLKLMTERVENIFVSRSKGKLSKSMLRRNWNRRDWWLDSRSASRLGVVDEIG